MKVGLPFARTFLVALLAALAPWWAASCHAHSFGWRPREEWLFLDLSGVILLPGLGLLFLLKIALFFIAEDETWYRCRPWVHVAMNSLVVALYGWVAFLFIGETWWGCGFIAGIDDEAVTICVPIVLSGLVAASVEDGPDWVLRLFVRPEPAILFPLGASSCVLFLDDARLAATVAFLAVLAVIWWCAGTKNTPESASSLLSAFGVASPWQH